VAAQRLKLHQLCHGFATAAEDAAAAGGDLAALLTVADRLGPPPALPGGNAR
jgi:hypothetical protein